MNAQCEQDTPTGRVPADHSKTLAQIGVRPGWFCRHSSCSIWVEVLQVFDDCIICVARDPSKAKDHVFHKSSHTWVDAFCPGKPAGNWIDRDRKKNFYDKFHPEVNNVIPQVQAWATARLAADRARGFRSFTP
jgi:hypothetical protein